MKKWIKNLFMAIFMILLVASLSFAVTLNWTAPAYNTDGSDLTDLDGYMVYYGEVSGTYTESVDISDESVTTYILLGNLKANTTYYFALTAYNTSGVPSVYSNEISYTTELSTLTPNAPVLITVTQIAQGVSMSITAQK